MLAMNKNQVVYIFFKIIAAAWSSLILVLCLKIKLYKGKWLERVGKISLESYLIYPHVFAVVGKMGLAPIKTILIGLFSIYRIYGIIFMACLHKGRLWRVK